MRIPLRFFEYGFIMLALFVGTAPLTTATAGAGDTGSGLGFALFRIAWAFIYLVVGIYSVIHHRQVIALFKANKALLLLVILAALSTFWSLDPTYTLRHSITLFATTLTGIYFALRYTPRQQARFLFIVLSIAIILGVIGELAFPSLLPPVIAFGPDADTSGWRGIYSHKNVFGRVIALALVAYFSLHPNIKTNLRALVVVGALGIVLLKSRSTSAVIVCLVTILFVKAARFLLWTPKRIFYTTLVGSVATLVAVYLVTTNFSEAMQFIGKDATLTGRRELWRLAIEQIFNRPLLGFGFEEFWRSEISERIRGETFGALHAHNGFIDTLLSFGLTGLTLFLVAYGTAMKRVVSVFRRGPSIDTVWQLSMLIFLFICQISESIFATWSPLFWLLFVSTACSASLTVAFADAEQPAESQLFLLPNPTAYQG